MREWTRLTGKRRKRLYGAAEAVVAVAAAYGLVSGAEADAWLFAVAALLDVARRNVNPDPPVE